MKKNLQETIRDSKPTLVCFMHAGRQDAVEVKYEGEELRRKFADKANIVLVDGSFNQAMMRQYHIATYPSWILFKDGQEVWHDGGMKPVSLLSDMINRFV